MKKKKMKKKKMNKKKKMTIKWKKKLNEVLL